MKKWRIYTLPFIRGGALDLQRGKAARYREKYNIRKGNLLYDELSGVVHEIMTMMLVIAGNPCLIIQARQWVRRGMT
jgi:hypothetical protein